MSIWFTSDHHFGHKRIIEFCRRPFADVAEMNEALVTWHNELVKPFDTVYHLGDLAMGDITDSLAWAGKLHGVKYLIPGNHDRMHSHYDPRKGPEYGLKFVLRYLYEAGFTALTQSVEISVGRSTNVLLTHLPPRSHWSWATDDRYHDIRPDTDLPVIHGHTHQEDGGDERHVHVGVDGRNYRPVAMDEVMAQIGVAS